MSITYRIYDNAGSGGPVDRSTLVASPSASPWLSAALTFPGDWTIEVASYDTVTGLESTSPEARVRIVLDAAGLDITGRPNAPLRLHAAAEAGGTARVSWVYNPALQGGAPTSFKVWATAGGSVNYAAAPVLTMAYAVPTLIYSPSISGLADGVAYAIGVRATNAAGDETNVASVNVTGRASGPSPVESLSASGTFLRGD